MESEGIKKYSDMCLATNLPPDLSKLDLGKMGPYYKYIEFPIGFIEEMEKEQKTTITSFKVLKYEDWLYTAFLVCEHLREYGLVNFEEMDKELLKDIYDASEEYERRQNDKG